jgi:hypothetical protein
MGTDPLTITVADEAERAFLLAALAMRRELADIGLTAPAGHVLDECERAALVKGRDLTRDLLQAAVQQRAQFGEKKGRRAEAVPAAPAGKTKAKPAAR